MRNGTIKGLLILCCAVAPAFARDEYSRDFRKTIDVASGRGFRVENSLGNVNIHTQGKNEAIVQATIRCSAENHDAARNCAEEIRIEIADTGSGPVVRTQYPNENKIWGRNRGYTVSYDITVPESSPVEVRNRFGSVTVVNPHAGCDINNGNGAVRLSGGRGRLRIENSFGDVEVTGNDGETVIVNGNGAVVASDVTGRMDLTTRFGNVRVTNAGRELTARTASGKMDVAHVNGTTTLTNSFGAVTVSDVKGNLIVRNQNGEITAEDIQGRADLNTSFGAIKFTRVGKELIAHATNAAITGYSVGANAVIETTFGNIDARNLKGNVRAIAGNSAIRLAGVGGDVEAKTSFGAVTVEDAGGSITVDNRNGAVSAVSKANKCQPITVHTSFAPIRVSLAQGAGYNLSAKTTFGRIHSDREMLVSGSMSPDTVNGKIGSGGCELRLINENGNIDIF